MYKKGAVNMKAKVFSFFTIINIYILVLSSCSTVAPATSAPIALTSTNTSSPVPTSTPTITPLPPTPTLVSETAFIKGITLNYSGNGPKLGTTDAQEVSKQYIIPSGANYVVLVPTCWSANMSVTDIICPTERIEGGVPPISDEELINAIHYLHSIGLRVALKPQALIQTVHITSQEKKERRWGENQWKAWFDSYATFITHYAEIAEAHQVDLFVVGNEQEDNTKREQDWRQVIASTRAVYHGSITYAANAWQFEASRIKFWDALDFIGTNGYQFGFVNKKDPTVDDMIQAWQPYIQQLEEMSNQYGKQVIITEVGAIAKEGWNTGRLREGAPTLYDGQEQADAYTAFFEALKDKPWLKGIILWDMDTDPLQGGPYDIGYTFIGKPAEKVVRQYFGGSAIDPMPTPDFMEVEGNSRIIYQDELAHGWRTWYEPDASVIPDLGSSNGFENSASIRLPLSNYKGIDFVYDTPFINMSKYKWLEFHIMVGEHQPKNLLVQFEYWTPESVNHSKLALVNSPDYIDGGQFKPDTWQRVKIPLIDMGISNQKFTGFGINNCAFPCQLDRSVDDVYIDDIRFVAGELPNSEIVPTFTPELVEDYENSLLLYKDGLENDWWMWDEEGTVTLSNLDFASGYQSSFSIRLQLSQIGILTLVYDAGPLDLSKYKWIELFLMVGKNQPKNLTVSVQDWAPGAPMYSRALADDPNYIEGGQYKPGVWQRIRIPLIDLGITEQKFRYTSAFGVHNCPSWPCGPDSIADDVLVDNIRLIASKSP
jgi:hypothetical protein